MRAAWLFFLFVGALLLASGNLFGSSFAQRGDDVSDQKDDGESPQEEDGEGDEGDREEEPVPSGCIRIGDQVSCPQSPAELAAQLIAEGPQLTTPTSERSFSVRGFVRNGWPIVIDFEPQPSTRTYVEIFPYETSFFNFRRVRIILDHDGSGGRQLFHGEIALPEDEAANSPVRVGDLHIVSRQLRPDGRMSRRRAPVRVFGIGAGPRAVGSISVADVMLAEGSDRLRLPASGGSSVRYSFTLRQYFDLVRADLWRQCNGFLCNNQVASLEVHRREGPVGGFAPIRRPGAYRLNVRAWLSCPTPDFQECGDDAAWATGRAGPLLAER